MKKVFERIYLAIILIFMYAPIVTLIILSFNSSKSRAKWGGFTFKWYLRLFSDEAVAKLTELGYSKEFGARNIARTVEDKIADSLVDEVLFGKLEKGGQCTAEYDKKSKEFRFIIK